MNYSTAVFLINDRVRAVQGTYEAGDTAPKTMFKTFDRALKVGDFALVPTNTRHNMTVVKITDVDVEFDIETHQQVSWIIGRIDLASYEQMQAQEQEAIKTIQSAEWQLVENAGEPNFANVRTGTGGVAVVASFQAQ